MPDCSDAVLTPPAATAVDDVARAEARVDVVCEGVAVVAIAGTTEDVVVGATETVEVVGAETDVTELLADGRTEPVDDDPAAGAATEAEGATTAADDMASSKNGLYTKETAKGSE